MPQLDYWILSPLLFGLLIAGVNQEISSTVINNLSARSVLSRESFKILYFHYILSHHDERRIEYVDNVHSRLQRQARSVVKSGDTICPPYDSCANRCGDIARTLPYTCNCDSSCIIFSDCCLDYNWYCRREENISVAEKQSLSIPRLNCEILFLKYNLPIINTCPEDYGDVFKREMCATRIPKDCMISDSLNVSDSDQVFEKCKQSPLKKCMSKLASNCDVRIEPLCKFISKNCNKFASKVCRKCDSSFWPALGKDGLIYRNSFCALCNSESNFTILSPFSIEEKMIEINELNVTDEHLMYFDRQCVPVDIDYCPKTVNDSEMHELCNNHTGAVFSTSKKNKIYKNAHCAMCNGEEFQNLQCVEKSSLISRLIVPLLRNFISGDSQGVKFDDIPAAFSILLNFGLDGQDRMYFNSESEEEMKRQQEHCGKGKMWDPFSEVCRKLYCSTEFILVDYQCVRKEIDVENDTGTSNDTSILPDTRAEFVHLSLSLEMELFDFLQFYGQEISAICETFRTSLANTFNINKERIQDVRFNISIWNYEGLNEFLDQLDDLSPIIFTLDFDLYEDFVFNITEPEPSVDRIVSMLASSLSMDGFELSINNVTSRIFEIHQTVSPLTSWCRYQDGGRKQEYWNSEFSLVLNDLNTTDREISQIRGIYINKTGKFYSHGDYVADILFQGYQFSSSLINVSGVAIVCDWNKLNESCVRFLIDSEEYSILENGSLAIHNENLQSMVDASNYEVADNGSVCVCISMKAEGKNSILNIKANYAQAMVSYVLLCISVIALAFVLITYMAFGSLRNLPGCNTMNLTFSLLVMQLTFLFGQKGKVTATACTVVGHLMHYEILCSFMWMNVMAFDLFRTFGNRNSLSTIRSKRKFLPRYMLYAYLSPISIIIIGVLLDCFLNDSRFAPNYGRGVCWIANQYSAIVFFAMPLAIIICVNFIFFLLTVFAMKSVKSLSYMKDYQQTKRNGKSDLMLYARMALVIGFTWVFSFSAASVRSSELIGEILTYLFIIFNTLQGVYIFGVFVCNKKVCELYREAFRSIMRKISKRSKYEGTSDTIAGFSDALKRTVSANTVVSTLSNASASSNSSQLSLVKE